MKNFQKYIIVLLALLLAVVLAACNSNTTNTSDKNDTSNTSADNKETGNKDGDITEKPKVVNIGYSGPLSGPAAYYGEATLSGLEVATEEINEAGGFEVNGQKYTINLVKLDDKYLPNETASNAKRMLQENKVSSIFVPHSGGILAMQVFNEQEKFLIMAYTSEPNVTKAGNKLTVAIPPRYDGYIKPFTDYSMERFGKKIAFLPTASQYGKDWASLLEPYWKEQGGEIVYNASIDFAKDTDFFTIITNALNENPDVLFIGGPSQPTAKVAKQARELGFEGGFIIMDQAKLDEMMEVTGSYESLEGGIGAMPLRHTDTPASQAFIEKYEAKYNKIPGSEAGFNYMGLYALVEAMKIAGTVEDAEKIRASMQEGIEAIPTDKHVYVIPGITPEGNFDILVNIGVVENGEVVPVNVE